MGLSAVPDMPRVWAQSGPAPASRGANIGAAAAEFEVTTLDGQAVRLDTFRGQPLVLNFFASWCDPCREEMPLLNALTSESGRRGYRVFGIAVQDQRGALVQYAKEGPVSFPIALDLNSRVQRAYWVFGPPATFFIDSHGMIRDRVLGPLSPGRAREALEKAGVGR
jgi:cytochrome c biogenesis protein CcmG/thiol:disulfide interchange protein DsbE